MLLLVSSSEIFSEMFQKVLDFKGMCIFNLMWILISSLIWLECENAGIAFAEF